MRKVVDFVISLDSFRQHTCEYEIIEGGGV